MKPEGYFGHKHCALHTPDTPLRLGASESCLAAAAGFFAFYDGMRAKMLQSVLAAALLNSIREKLNEAAKVMLSGPITPPLGPVSGSATTNTPPAVSQ